MPEFQPQLMMVGRRHGEWTYIHTCETQMLYTGIRPFGLVRSFAPPVVWSQLQRLYDKSIDTATPFFMEDTGYIGKAVDILTRYCRIPCRPANGYDAIIASVWEWRTEMDPGQEEMLADFLLRVCGPVHRSLFLAPSQGRPRVAAQIALLREVAEGGCGCLVSEEDRVFLQLFLMGLRVEHMHSAALELLTG